MSGLQTSTARWMTVHNSTELRFSSIFPRAIRVTSKRSSIRWTSISTLRRIISSRSRVRSGRGPAGLEHRHAHHHRRQGRAQFVAEDRQEVVLGTIGLLGGSLRLYQSLLHLLAHR